MKAFLKGYFRAVAPIAHYVVACLALLAGVWATVHPTSYSMGRWVLVPVLLVLVMSIPLRLFVNIDRETSKPRLVVDNSKYSEKES